MFHEIGVYYMKKKNRYEQKKTGRSGFWRGALAVLAVTALTWCSPFVSRADITGTVKVESANIRGSADSTSAAVGSVTRGKTVSIKSETTDASGARWYEVYVNANTTGYVRADLIDRDGTESLPTSGGGAQAGEATEVSQGEAQGETASGALAQAETAMDAQYAKVKVQSAKIRPEPSTNVKEVESVPNGTELIVSGQSNGASDGKVWYFVTFTGADGSSKTGFVRSDLVDLGDMVPVPEEQPAPEEQPVPEETQEPVSQDYEVAQKDGEWYLIDNLGGGYEYKLQPLLDAYSMQSDTADEDAKSLVRQRIVIVVLGVLTAALLIVVIIMGIKLRDAYYEDYEDDDEDDEEEDDDEEAEEVPVRRRRRAESDGGGREEERPVRRNMRDTDTVSRRAAREQQSANEQAEEVRVKPAPKRKAKNFLLDDDDFEFEFLNMDDKDL